MARKSPSSLKDVARVAGVSVPTASQALNDRPRVRAETKQRVRDAARRLRYAPHAAARRLILGRSDCVAIVPGTNTRGIFSDLFYRAILSGIGGVFEETPWRMVITPPVPATTTVPQFVQMAHAREVDGILIAGVADRAWIREATEAGVPVVLLDNHCAGLAVPAVVNDNAGGAYTATRHLASLGHTRIALVGAAVDYPFGAETHDGYRRALADAGIAPDPDIETRTAVDAGAAYERAAALLALASPPSAVFAVTDAMAFGVIKAVRDRGLRVPDDISVVGMDDIELASITDPPLTTIRIHKEEMGRRAAEVLLKGIRRRRVEPGLIVLANELVVRGTTGGRR